MPLESAAASVVSRLTLLHTCLHSRRLVNAFPTTGLAACHGKHVIKAAPTTQTVIALPGGTALGMESMAKDHGNEVKVALETDSVSGRGVSLRLGFWRVRHVDTQWLCVQGVFHRREATIRKIPGVSNGADFMTNFCEGKKIQEFVSNMVLHCTKGRSQLALKAALDGLSQTSPQHIHRLQRKECNHNIEKRVNADEFRRLQALSQRVSR